MTLLRRDEPPWAAALRTSGPEVAAAIMRELAVRELTIEPDVEHRRVIASCTIRHNDHYGVAYEMTEQLASLWEHLGADSIDLRIHVDALQVDVPGRFFTDPGDGNRRRRWATLSGSQLAHRA